MKRKLLLFFALLLLFTSPFNRAELLFDSSLKPKQVEKLVTPLFKSTVRPYGDEHSVDWGGSYGKRGTFDHEDDKFAWLFNRKRLFSMVGSFTPEVVQLKDCRPDPNELAPGSRCDWRRMRFNVCHLFMFGEDLKLESVARLNINRDTTQLQGLPMCLSVKAMAVAKVIPDAMLITLGYIDSAEPAEKNSGPPEFTTTLLLRFHDQNRKLKIEQDDSCLGNPNKYKTILAARAALGKCISRNNLPTVTHQK